MSQVRVGDRAELADELAEGGLCDLHRSLTKLTMRRGSEERFVPPLSTGPASAASAPGCWVTGQVRSTTAPGEVNPGRPAGVSTDSLTLAFPIPPERLTRRVGAEAQPGPAACSEMRLGAVGGAQFVLMSGTTEGATRDGPAADPPSWTAAPGRTVRGSTRARGASNARSRPTGGRD